MGGKDRLNPEKLKERLQPLVVMIVDDDPMTLSVTAAVLARRGHRVIKRSSPIGTTVAITRERPDVVVLDVNMPGLSGDRIAQLVRSAPGANRPALILYSGMVAHELRELAQSCGASGVISKDGDPDHFVKELERIAASERSVAFTSNG